MKHLKIQHFLCKFYFRSSPSSFFFHFYADISVFVFKTAKELFTAVNKGCVHLVTAPNSTSSSYFPSPFSNFPILASLGGYPHVAQHFTWIFFSFFFLLFVLSSTLIGHFFLFSSPSWSFLLNCFCFFFPSYVISILSFFNKKLSCFCSCVLYLFLSLFHSFFFSLFLSFSLSFFYSSFLPFFFSFLIPLFFFIR